MLHAPRIPELAQRDRFVRRAVRERRIYTLKDEENACVPSNRLAGRTVQLFWSSPLEAERWAAALAGEGTLQDITLDVFAAEILPGLQSGKGLAGVDWVADPIEPECEPVDLLWRLKAEAVAGFVAGVADRGEIFIFEGDIGPYVEAVTRRQGNTHLLRVFATREEAERAQKSTGGRRVIADPIGNFRSSTLAWAVARGLLVGLEPIPGAGLFEAEAAAISAKFARS